MRNPKLAYNSQKQLAKYRNVDWNITFDEWINWWGSDFVNRGKNVGDLQMCRYNDSGAYELGNIYKATISHNSRKYAKQVKINGVAYESRGEASRATGINPHTISYRVKQGWKGYEYV